MKMPNTLAHMAVGRITSRTILGDVDDKWIYIGCIIPDIPWIIQRIVVYLLPEIDLIDLRLYVIVQASLFFGLIFSAALALLVRRPLQIFLLLGFNCVIHLLLDAGQIKWANGVHFFAPLSWQMTGFGFFWPESVFAYLLTGLGLILILWRWQSAWHTPVHLLPLSYLRMIPAIGLLLIYFILPFVWLNAPEEADNHFLATLRDVPARTGRPIAFDRCVYHPETETIRIFSGETIALKGFKWPRTATISIKGTFTSTDRIEVHAFHIHHPFRDLSSLLGLALITILWFTAGWKRRITWVCSYES